VTFSVELPRGSYPGKRVNGKEPGLGDDALVALVFVVIAVVVIVGLLVALAKPLDMD
jgi:hypothetical protein